MTAKGDPKTPEKAGALKCERLVKIFDGVDANTGKRIWYHRRCNLAAAEVEIGGTLGKAKAVLCSKHRLAADRECFTSANGFPLGKITKKDKAKGYTQKRGEGTGLLCNSR